MLAVSFKWILNHINELKDGAELNHEDTWDEVREILDTKSAFTKKEYYKKNQIRMLVDWCSKYLIENWIANNTELNYFDPPFEHENLFAGYTDNSNNPDFIAPNGKSFELKCWKNRSEAERGLKSPKNNYHNADYIIIYIASEKSLYQIKDINNAPMANMRYCCSIDAPWFEMEEFKPGKLSEYLK